MHKTLPKFADCRVLVIGDIMLDRYMLGSTSRISPEAPVPVVKVNNQHDKPGGAGNVALNVRSLGAQVRLLAVVGNDDHAERLPMQTPGWLRNIQGQLHLPVHALHGHHSRVAGALLQDPNSDASISARPQETGAPY